MNREGGREKLEERVGETGGGRERKSGREGERERGSEPKNWEREGG